MKSWLAESWLALQHLTATALPDKFTVTYLDFAPYGHHGWAACNLHSFEAIVVVVRVLRFGGQHTSIIRVVNHEVGVTPHGNRALAREKPKQFRCASARNVHEAIKFQPPAFYPVGIQKIYAFFDTRNSVGNVDEGILAEKFLLRVDRAMIRANGIDRAERQRIPKRSLIVLSPQRRRHYVLHAFYPGLLGKRLVAQ